ncbi:MAG: energy-coupling factor ABC transporter ATP-binding protein [Candidatus Omnitrophica bacterium]|nr:energy-coupling factor ABC transporter ATP-binding protein [Candidatus Omnitrophota bacterium]
MDNTIFRLQDVKFSYLGRYPALCGIDMEIVKGQRVAVMGANGSGKSTLLQMLDGLLFPDTGTIEAFGRTLNEKAFTDTEFNRYFRSKVGLVFQSSDVQLFCPTVKEELLFGPLQFGFAKTEIRSAFDTIVGLLDIEGLLDRMPHQLSVGEKRKVAIASVLMILPDIILLDEPTAGLDPRTSRELANFLARYHDENKTIITATHDLHIIEEIADIIYVIDQNRKIIRRGSPHELLEDTAFLEENNLIHSHLHRHEGMPHVHKHDHLSHYHHHS